MTLPAASEQVLRNVTGLHDITEKDVEEWRVGLSPFPARAPYLSPNALGYSRCFAFSCALSQIFRRLLFPLSLSLPFRMLFKEKLDQIDGRTGGREYGWHA